MTRQAIASTVLILFFTLLHALAPNLAGPILTCTIGALGIASVFLVSRPKDLQWIAALESAISQEAGPEVLARLRLNNAWKTPKTPPPAMTIMLILWMAVIGACSSLPAIVHNAGNCLADILDATQGTEDPVRIASDCGATLDALITAIQSQLNQPASDAGARALDPAHQARLERILARAQALKAQGVK